ncbi:hypothetical protein GJAV_G00037390 [Gymnothorax javanicus]|nr:hypothetical protein GJAV_G00037390 [Gymnothorax javanicus]
MTEDTLVYTFTLNYQPKALSGTLIIRTSSAMVGIQCHYLPSRNRVGDPCSGVCSIIVLLEADNWQMERVSNVVFLRDLINIEASVVQANLVPSLCL